MSKTLAALLAEKARLDAQIAAARQAERGQAITRVKALMDEYGLTLADLQAGGTRAAPPKAESAPAKASRKGKPLGKVAPKYRDPATGATWSGRGLQPKWLVAALAAGRRIDEFRL